MPLKTTFVLLKPDAHDFSMRQGILDMILARGFRIKRSLEIPQATRPQVEAHLKDLKAKNFAAYLRNVAFLLSGPVLALELELPDGEDPVLAMRELAGPTDPANTTKGNIRRLSSDTIAAAVAEERAVRNLIHAADSGVAVKDETHIWFGASVTA